MNLDAFNIDDILKVHPKLVVHNDDLQMYERLNIKNHEAVIAGGCALSWYTRQPVGKKDIDIWFPNQKRLEAMSQELLSNSKFRKVYDTKDAETYKYQKPDSEYYRIQLIKNRFFAYPTDVIDSFDITVCQIATDGETWWIGDQFSQDLKNRRLRLIKTHSGSVKRLLKYWTYGFHPEDTELQAIIDDPEVTWDYESNTDEEYANAI
jgi:hypothetical protein